MGASLPRARTTQASRLPFALERSARTVWRDPPSSMHAQRNREAFADARVNARLTRSLVRRSPRADLLHVERSDRVLHEVRNDDAASLRVPRDVRGRLLLIDHDLERAAELAPVDRRASQSPV